MRYLVCPLAVCTLAVNAAAQNVYYAGVEGNPPTAPSPTTQGWTQLLSGNVSVMDVSPDPNVPVNAWQITDQGTGEAVYRTQLFQGTDNEANLNVRMLAGSVFLTWDTGDMITDSFFELELEVVGTDVLLHRPPDPPILCPDGADGQYHTYSLTGLRFLLDFRYDGVLLGQVCETALGFIEYGADFTWGSGDPAGRARFHRVVLRRAGPGEPLGSVYCAPAVVNSSGLPGQMALLGSTTVSDDDLTLVASSLPTGSNIGYFIMGGGHNTFTPPGSSGPICIAPGIKRFLPPVSNTNETPGGFTRVVGASGPVSSSITAGSTWNFQAWHRDGMNPSNLTEAVTVTFE